MNATALPRWDALVEGFTGSRTETRALVDYCKVFTSEDAMRWALQAVMQASAAVQASEGPWVEQGVPWSSPRLFADEVLHQFQRRVWNACQRSPRFREVEEWDARRGDFVAVQDHELPPSKNPGNNASELGADGAS